MSEYRENFKKWFVDILGDLINNRADTAGAILLLVSFPLLERYLRATEGKEEARWYKRLPDFFPKLVDADKARDFWTDYRNSLLHQVTLGGFGHAWRVDEHTEAVELGDGDRFLVNPVKFAQRILQIIEDNFDLFAQSPLVSKHPYLEVQGTNTAASTRTTPLTYQDRYE